MLSEKNWFIRTLIETEQFSVGWWWWLNYKYILYLKFTWPNMTYLSKLWQTQMGISCDENAHRNACRMFRDGALAFCGPAGARNFITSTRTMLQRNIRLSSMEVQTRASNMLLYGVSSIQHLRMIKSSIFVFVTWHVEGQMFGELIYFHLVICRQYAVICPQLFLQLKPSPVDDTQNAQHAILSKNTGLDCTPNTSQYSNIRTKYRAHSQITLFGVCVYVTFLTCPSVALQHRQM